MRAVLLIAAFAMLLAGCGAAAPQADGEAQPESGSSPASSERPPTAAARAAATAAPAPLVDDTPASVGPADPSPAALPPDPTRPTEVTPVLPAPTSRPDEAAPTPASAGQPPAAAVPTPLAPSPDLTALALPAPVGLPPVGVAGEPAIVTAERVARLRADLAARSGADPAAIRLVGAEAVTWSDGSLGCPQPGVNYTQVPVDGLRVLLEVGGEIYDYRVGKRERFVLCR